MLAKAPILENVFEESVISTENSNELITDTLIKYSEWPFKDLKVVLSPEKKWHWKEAWKLLNKILELELESVDSYIWNLE